jgi:hypothetical protein
MDYKLLNEKLNDLDTLRRTKVEKSKVENEDCMPEWYEVCPFDEDTFIRLKVRMDSYGENESVVGIEFVKPKQVTTTNYEAI